MYLEIKDLKKSYGDGNSYTQVLRGITTNIREGDPWSQRIRKIHFAELCRRA